MEYEVGKLFEEHESRIKALEETLKGLISDLEKEMGVKEKDEETEEDGTEGEVEEKSKLIKQKSFKPLRR